MAYLEFLHSHSLMLFCARISMNSYPLIFYTNSSKEHLKITLLSGWVHICIKLMVNRLHWRLWKTLIIGKEFLCILLVFWILIKSFAGFLLFLHILAFVGSLMVEIIINGQAMIRKLS